MLKNNLQAAIVNSWSESHRSGHFHLEVALSGGLDSIALLHLLISLKESLNCHISAVHVNHQLQAVSAQWVTFCQHICAQWQVPLRVETVKVEQVAKLGVEAAARNARYQAFAKTQADVVVLAHHSDDQVETALLAFLRGGGLRALAAMPAWRELNGKVAIWRPLLHISKSELEQYAQECHLEHIEDPSNTDDTYTRNWLRQVVLPQILAHEEHANKKILAGVMQRQQELSLLTEIQQQDWGEIFEKNIFNINKMLKFSSVRMEQQLLYFAKYYQLGSWSRVKLHHFLEKLVNFPNSRHQIGLGLGEIQADRGRLYPWGCLQKEKFEHLFTFCDDVFINVRISQETELADFKVLSNTGQKHIIRKNGMVLRPLYELRLLLEPFELQRLIKTLKAKKVPLFVMEYWPCWFNDDTHQALATKIQDNEIRHQFPVWEERLAFLEVYLTQVN